jgi:SSS family solute:Na+ symporter
MHLAWVDYLIIAVYFVFVLGIGFALKRRNRSSSDFLQSGRSLPLWITGLAFISANLGAQEVIGMAASGAKYGIMTSHFYWLGAIPAMVFLAIFMMPFYYGSRARSVPEYLKLRFDEKTRTFNAISFAAMTLFSSGISLYALALLFQTLLGWNFHASILLSAGIVMVYTFVGGLTSAVYNEVLQFFLITLGIAPMVYVGLNHVGGWAGVQAQLAPQLTHTWQYMQSETSNPMGVNLWEMTMGLGFVLSFGYWCTDFLVVQRAMIARDMKSAQKTPLVAAFPKMLLPFVVILPGLIGAVMHKTGGEFSIPLKPDGSINYDLTLPSLLSHFYPSGMLGVGLVALIASFMSGMAGNVTAFNSVWTYDIYQPHLKPDATDEHYLRVAKATTVVGILLSIVTAYMAQAFNNIMDFLQLVFGFINAPLFATFFLGMFWKRTTGHGGFAGLVAGTLGATLTHGLTSAEGKGGWMVSEPVHTFASSMGHAFFIAIVAWTVCFIVTAAVSLITKAPDEARLRGLVYSLTDRAAKDTTTPWYSRPVTLSVIILTATALLNLVFW